MSELCPDLILNSIYCISDFWNPPCQTSVLCTSERFRQVSVAFLVLADELISPIMEKESVLSCSILVRMLLVFCVSCENLYLK